MTTTPNSVDAARLPDLPKELQTAIDLHRVFSPKRAAELMQAYALAAIAAQQEKIQGHLAEVEGVAKQVRDMGLKVGDTIFGRESGNGYNGYWHEARLTLLWVGQSQVVWLERERSDNNPEWSEPVETADWTLDVREWSRVADFPATAEAGHG